jgi:hypothetical protein
LVYIRIGHADSLRSCSAVLGTYFLKEELGTLGKLGCAICLIGSVIIVLHAPPDKDIDRIDEILNFAIQPGALIHLPIPGCPDLWRFHLTLLHVRVSAIRRSRHYLFPRHDLQSLSDIRKEEPTGLHLNLQYHWFIDGS